MTLGYRFSEYEKMKIGEKYLKREKPILHIGRR